MINKNIAISPKLSDIIEQIDVSKVSLQKNSSLRPELLQALRYVATIESVGSSTRMAGSKLSDREVELILSRLTTGFFKSRDEEQRLFTSLSKLASDILQLAQNKGKISIADIIAETNAPRSTIKKQLALLVDQKYLSRHGQGRSVWYARV